MGQDIDSSCFTEQDFECFQQRLADETRFLGKCFADGCFDNSGKISGFELEAWLLDDQGYPAPLNKEFLQLTAREGLPVVAELAKFNVELNSDPRFLSGSVFSDMYQQLSDSWASCCKQAEALNCSLLMIGTLPTVREQELTVANMSNVPRYKALNDQVFRLREGRPLQLNIKGRQHLKASHDDVMTEAATTSFQLHLQTEPEKAIHYYNAAHILSAPIVAIAANSPYLFGHDLWDETRIPLFEQAVAVGSGVDGAYGKVGRVTFGAGYVESSLFECFERNQDCYPVLLPALTDSGVEKLDHLRLHNGTIWRWNRPLIGVNGDGKLHLRIEHRVIPAGPTVIDAIANAALFFGAVEVLSQRLPEPEAQLPFELARQNFYAAAKDGLASSIVWLNGEKVSMVDLLQDEILPMARQGLESLAVDMCDIDKYMGIIEARLQTRQNGAAWQRAYISKHGDDYVSMVKAYSLNQQKGHPVHEWQV